MDHIAVLASGEIRFETRFEVRGRAVPPRGREANPFNNQRLQIALPYQSFDPGSSESLGKRDGCLSGKPARC
jgi:hypothetical protein